MATPLCPYFGRCGGCSLQHIEYQQQLEQKKVQLAKATDFSDIEVFSGNPYHYRNRMDFIFHPKGLGLREKGKWHKIVDIEECMISNTKLNQLLTEIRIFFQNIDVFDLKKHTGTFRYAVIRTPQKDSSISFVLNPDSTRLQQAIKRIKEFSEKTSADNIMVTYVKPNTDMSISSDYFVVKGKDTLQETFLEKTFTYSTQGFFQNNSLMAEKMQQYVNKKLKEHNPKNSHLLDLYGGVGTFGIINSNMFNTTTIVESVKECIDSAEINIKQNSTENTKAVLLDAKQLKRLDLQKPLIVITDPPRSGMHPKTLQTLNELLPKRIIYISCNVKQLEKDLPKFKNYKIKSVALFDLFPQTTHSEALVEMVND